jgi:CBS domain-containing protein
MHSYISSSPEKENDTIRNIMKRPIFVEADEQLSSAIAKTVDHHVARLPVVDSASTMRCVGLVTATELLKASAGKR